MEKIKFTPKFVVVGIIMLIVSDVVLLLLGALLVRQGFLAFDGVDIWSLASLVIASFVSSILCSSRSGIRMNAYAAAVGCFMVLVLMPIVTCGTCISLGTGVKEFTALICGTFIGNFFGISRHNRLRKFGKKKRLYTK